MEAESFTLLHARCRAAWSKVNDFPAAPPSASCPSSGGHLGSGQGAGSQLVKALARSLTAKPVNRQLQLVLDENGQPIISDTHQ
jgi:hypothetical protein